jgi:hypothetical protein
MVDRGVGFGGWMDLGKTWSKGLLLHSKKILEKVVQGGQTGPFQSEDGCVSFWLNCCSILQSINNILTNNLF